MSSGVTSVSAGGHTTCAIQNGALKCWGYNAYGQVGDGSATSRAIPVPVSGMDSGVTEVSVGNEYSNAASHTCAIQNGAVKCWGYNGWRQIGDGSTTNRTAPYAIAGLDSGVSQVSATSNRTCVIQNGGVKCWGYNANGQVGDGTTTHRSVPTNVVGLDQGVTTIGGGIWHTCAVKLGRLVCWGYNNYGQLGDGTNVSRSAPVQVSGMESDVEQVGVSDLYGTCAFKAGRLQCWGYNGFGQLGDGSTANRFAPGLVSGW